MQLTIIKWSVKLPFYMEMATGMLVSVSENPRRVQFRGTCAAYRERNILLTAAHCLEGDGDEQPFFAIMPGEGQSRRIVNGKAMEGADIALLISEPMKDELASQVYSDIDNSLTVGQDFVAFGYPDVVSATGPLPEGRIFKGHFQRFFGYKDSHGRRYFAGEMSIPAPAGLSGGPVVQPYNHQLITGIVTANVDSYIVVDQVEEVEDGDKRFRLESRRIVSYGIAAKPGGLKEWLEEAIDEMVSS